MTGTSRYEHPNMVAVTADPVKKIGVMADYVAAIFHAYTEARAAQLIYCETVMVYAAIRRELVARGIPAGEIAFIQDYDTKTKKAALFRAVNTGTIRVLLASKQSTGMNIQQRLIALHHLDCPWRPGDLEQREGRIVRQGNVFPEVMLFAYVTESSFDGYRWQTVETKAGFIEQMKRGDVTVREVDDLGDAVLSAAEIKAIASGNPLVMEKVKLEMGIQQLEAGEAADRYNRVKLRQRLISNQHEHERQQLRIPLLQAAQSQAEQSAGQPFKAAILDGVMVTDATAYTKREAAGEAVLKIVAELDALTQARRERQTRTIGRYRGFVLVATAYLMGTAEVTLRIEQGEQLTHLTTHPISLKTPSGVFQSVDRQIAALGEEIARVERRLAELNQDDATIASILATAWPQQDDLRLARERMERLDAELARAAEAPRNPEDAVIPVAALSIPDQARSATFTIVTECDDDHLAIPIPEMVRPIVLLPEPADLEAMQAAIRQLSGALVEHVEEDTDAVEIAAIAVEEHTTEVAAGVLTEPVVAVEAHVHSQPTDHSHVVRSPRQRPIFGQRLRSTHPSPTLPPPQRHPAGMDDLPLFAEQPALQQSCFL